MPVIPWSSQAMGHMPGFLMVSHAKGCNIALVGRCVAGADTGFRKGGGGVGPGNC